MEAHSLPKSAAIAKEQKEILFALLEIICRICRIVVGDEGLPSAGGCWCALDTSVERFRWLCALDGFLSTGVLCESSVSDTRTRITICWLNTKDNSCRCCLLVCLFVVLFVLADGYPGMYATLG